MAKNNEKSQNSKGTFTLTTFRIVKSKSGFIFLIFQRLKALCWLICQKSRYLPSNSFFMYTGGALFHFHSLSFGGSKHFLFFFYKKSINHKDN